MVKKKTIKVCTGIGLNMFFPEYITIEIPVKLPKKLDVSNIPPITKLTQEQFKDLGLIK